MEMNINPNLTATAANNAEMANVAQSKCEREQSKSFVVQMKAVACHHQPEMHRKNVILFFPLPVDNFEARTNFTKDDISLLDKNKDGSIDKAEWEQMGLNGSLFRYISGADEKISKEEWGQYVDKQTLRKHQGNIGGLWPDQSPFNITLFLIPSNKHHHRQYQHEHPVEVISVPLSSLDGNG